MMDLFPFTSQMTNLFVDGVEILLEQAEG